MKFKYVVLIFCVVCFDIGTTAKLRTHTTEKSTTIDSNNVTAVQIKPRLSVAAAHLNNIFDPRLIRKRPSKKSVAIPLNGAKGKILVSGMTQKKLVINCCANLKRNPGPKRKPGVAPRTTVRPAENFKVTKEVYFDIKIDGVEEGRIVIGLFGETAPKTVENFFTIATTGIDGKTYAGTTIHRVIKRFMIQGGDIVSKDGTGSLSIYGESFKDENFDIKHTAPGFLSMANAGPNTNGCQFFITTVATPWLDGHHTIFGKVIKNQALVHKIENLETDSEDHPVKTVEIYASGEEPLDTPYVVSDQPYDGSALWAWLKAASPPLAMSFMVLGFFHWVIAQLDMVA